MRKLSLRIEELRIDSFATAAGPAERGTVAARAAEEMTDIWTCFGEETRDGLCPPQQTFYIGCGSGYTACEACLSYGYPGGGDACMQTVESDCRTQTVC